MRILALMLIFVLSVSCTPKKEKTVTEVKINVAFSITESTPQPILKYLALLKIVDSSYRYRMDFIKAFIKACQNDAFSDKGDNRPAIGSFETVISVFYREAEEGAFKKINNLKKFFPVADYKSVEKNYNKFNEVLGFIKRIYSRPAIAGDSSRVIGGLKNLVEIDYEFVKLAEQVLKEYIGKNSSNLNNHKMRYYEEIIAFSNFSLALNLQNNFLGNFKLLPLKEMIAGNFTHSLRASILIFELVDEKRRYLSCQKTSSIFNKNVSEKNSICKLQEDLGHKWRLSLSLVKAGKMKEFIKSVKSMTLLNTEILNRVTTKMNDIGFNYIEKNNKY